MGQGSPIKIILHSPRDCHTVGPYNTQMSLKLVFECLQNVHTKLDTF